MADPPAYGVGPVPPKFTLDVGFVRDGDAEVGATVGLGFDPPWRGGVSLTFNFSVESRPDVTDVRNGPLVPTPPFDVVVKSFSSVALEPPVVRIIHAEPFVSVTSFARPASSQMTSNRHQVRSWRSVNFARVSDSRASGWMERMRATTRPGLSGC